MTDEELANAWTLHKKLFPDLDQADVFDPELQNNMPGLIWNDCLELTWNHDNPDNFKVHDGNAEPCQGFGHIGFLLDNLSDSCAKMVRSLTLQSNHPDPSLL